MNTIAVAKKTNKFGKVASWFGTCSSAICAVHCFGTAIVAIIAPGLLKFIPHSESAEIIILSVSMLTSIFSLRRAGAKAGSWTLYSIFSFIGIAGIVEHQHTYLGFALFTLAALQISLLWKSHHPTSKADTPECCEHEH